MKKYAREVVQQAQTWLGRKESDGSHRQIIDVYNSHKPLARGYAVKYTDPWCAAFVSAVAVKLGYTDIIPTECSCPKMIDLFKKLGVWVEEDSYTPAPGDILFYDWDDSGIGDNTGGSDHVGIVEAVSGGKITVIEGNYANSVKRRTLSVNGRYIRGYGVPRYEKETNQIQEEEKTVNIKLNVLKKGSCGEQVKALQRMLYAMGYQLGTKNPIDGDFGSKTDAAVRAYQKSKGLTVDGIVGVQTWGSLLGA